jgi:conjugal transfer pilus assembly protein TraB
LQIWAILRLSVLEKQKRLLLVIIVTALGSGGFVYILITPSLHSKSTIVKNSVPIHTPGTTVQSNEIWMQQMSQESKLQNQKLDLLEKIVTKQALAEKPENTELAEIKQDLAALKQWINQSSQPLHAAEEGEEPAVRVQHIPMAKHTLSLRHARYPVGQHIPSGTYVKAILLSAVDASVGINVSGDPQPVLLRLLDDACLPNNASTRMKRCHIMGAARGDLSSERVFIRLEKMSCIDTETNTIIETDVAGYVTGEDGRNGLQGVVADRSGRMISSAVLVGMLSGATSFLQTWVATRGHEMMLGKAGERGVQNNVMSPDFMRSSGSTQGVSNAFDKLADYYIKRAEQLQPVVIINAGRTVNIVFSRGARYGVEYQEKPHATG